MAGAEETGQLQIALISRMPTQLSYLHIASEQLVKKRTSFSARLLLLPVHKLH